LVGMRSVNRLAGCSKLPGLALAVLALVLGACRSGQAGAAPAATGIAVPEVVKLSSTTALIANTLISSNTVVPTSTQAPSASPTIPVQSSPTPPEATSTPTPEAIPQTTLSSPTLTPTESVRLSADDWKLWPVIPQVPLHARALYQQGLALGNDPHAFSILGDCQSLPETFMGVYETDPELVASLPADLQAVVANFSGSFNRESPTVKGGTTAGAVLWDAWHENKYTCQASETPLDCELRLHKPSIVIINLGTHYETRNIIYMRMILDRLTAQGVIPILTTKADNRELDERLNQEMALLAVEYDVPLWNFWAAVSDLPNNGVGVKKGEEFLGEIYLSEEGLERHRYTALQTLEAVWEAVK
jgi:hypothetical protein